jgi:hypothetical protein
VEQSEQETDHTGNPEQGDARFHSFILFIRNDAVFINQGVVFSASKIELLKITGKQSQPTGFFCS